jgi:hypothetical protein
VAAVPIPYCNKTFGCTNLLPQSLLQHFATKLMSFQNFVVVAIKFYYNEIDVITSFFDVANAAQ